MPAREDAPLGAPCWIDLMTSDTQRTRVFYIELFGWTADEPNAEFGGYFNFRKDGVLVAGCMARDPGNPMPDTWSVHLATDDAAKTLEVALSHGGRVLIEPMHVGELGTMAAVIDPGGAVIGVWKPGLHKGFGVLGEPGAPSWFELHTRDYEASVAFYRDVFGWDAQTMSDAPEFRYTVLQHGDTQLAGIMDASVFPPDGVPAHWAVYFGVTDTDEAVATVLALGGAVVRAAEDTPYGRLAVVTDPTGAQFRLMSLDAGAAASA
jgi:predicted enzyme related to lactoylglutathione lyase